MGNDDSAIARPVPGSTGDSAWFVDMKRFSQSAHASFQCSECHGTMTENGRKHPDEKRPDFLKRSATRTYDYSRCRKCHELSYRRYLEGGHAKARQEEKKKGKKVVDGTGMDRMAPTCGDCHVSHYVRSSLQRVEVGRNMIDVCGGCHPAHTTSYLDNIHGRLAIDLKDARAALCTDCHGAHTVDSLDKQKNALTICQRCHRRAENEFTGIVIHATLESAAAAETKKETSIKWIQRIRWVAVIIVIFSLTFFVAHSVLWLLREIHEKLRKH